MSKYVYKSAVDGTFVSKAFADDHPETTYRMSIENQLIPAGVAVYEEEPEPEGVSDYPGVAYEKETDVLNPVDVTSGTFTPIEDKAEPSIDPLRLEALNQAMSKKTPIDSMYKTLTEAAWIEGYLRTGEVPVRQETPTSQASEGA